MRILKFGILSTASVNSYSFLPVIKKVAGAKLVAIASRDPEVASRYAARHGITKSYGGYAALLADPQIDCVYIPLPVSMHAEWSIRALEAGKHVLCEKPVAANMAEALAIAETVKKTRLTFAEAFHYRYHPLASRVEGIVRSGDIGEIRKITAVFGTFLPDKNKVQFKPELAGGALLDVGCYPVSFTRWIADCDTARVVAAHAEMIRSGVDGTTRATLEFENGVKAKIHCSLIKLIPMSALIRGTKGDLFILSPFSPSVAVGPLLFNTHLLILRCGRKIRSIRVPSGLTYHCQLVSFCEAVRSGRQPITNAEEGVANMRLIDAIFQKAGVRKPQTDAPEP